MFLHKYEPQLYAVLRIVTGFLFIWPGSMKLFNFPVLGGPGGYPLHVVAIAGPIEFFGGILMMLGLWTRWAAFVASGEMAYAYWTVHAPNAVLPIVNNGQLAVVYCFLFLFFAAHGPGIWSLDNFISARMKK